MSFFQLPFFIPPIYILQSNNFINFKSPLFIKVIKVFEQITNIQMSKAYFTLIGDELYNLKNSPFMRLDGERRPQPPLRSSLAYDPDRFFNPDKNDEKLEDMDEDYVEFKKREQEELAKIQYDLLKKNTNEEYQKRVKKMESMRRYDHKRPYSWFGVYRGMCLTCDKCAEYEGYFNRTHLKSTSDLQLMECIKCKCPMNSHIPITSKNPFRDTIWKHLKKQQIQDQHLNADFFLMAFKAKQNDIQQYEDVIDIFSHFQCDIIDAKIITKLGFQLGLVRSIIINKGVEKGYLQSVLNLIECIEAEEEWKWSSEKLSISQYYQELYEMIKLTVSGLQLQLQDDEKVVVFLGKSAASAKTGIKNMMKKLSPQIKGFDYCWSSSSNKESLISCQIFFPQYFQVKYNVFLLPGKKQQNQWSNQRFKDILDYNGYILLMQNLKNVERAIFQKTFRQFNTHKINYILGEQILSKTIKKVGFKLAASIGPAKFSLPFNNYPDFVNVAQPQYIAKALKNLYPQYCYSERCALVIRPFAISSNFEEVIVNLLRINKFVLIKRIKVKLDESEAKYLATLENIEETKLEQYIEFMTTGVCEIVLVSKRSAIYEAYALATGCESGINNMYSKSLKQKPILEMKRGRDIYQYQVPFNTDKKSKNKEIFTGLNQMISLQKVLFGSYSPSLFATNSSTGEIIKVEGTHINEQATLKISNKMKQSLLKELKSDTFNYWMYTSKSQTLTQEIAGMFLPECTLFEPITLIIKPGFTHLTTLIKNALIEHKYHIIKDKEIQMSKVLAAEFVLNCQKIKLTKDALRYIIDCYTNQKIHILCVSKISGRKEIMSMLREFTFISKKNYSVEQMITDEMLMDMLVPVWNNEEMCLKILSKPLGNLEESIKQLQSTQLSKQQKFDVLNYLVGSFFGVSLEDLSMNTKIGKLSYYISDQYTPKLQSWYYSLVSHSLPNNVPLLFQYRHLGQTTLCIQCDQGAPFMSMIFQQFVEERNKMIESDQKKRKSLILFLWARKIVQLVNNLSQVRCNLKDFGQIIPKNGQYRGDLSLERALENEKKFLEKMSREFEIHRQIKKNIKKLQGSRHLSERYIDSNKRLLPSFHLDSLHKCLRVVEKSQVSRLHLMNKYALIDPNNQHDGTKDMYNLTLFNIVPQIKTRYSLAAQVYFFLLKQEFQNTEGSEMCIQMLNLYADHFTEMKDLEVLQYEIYLCYLRQFWGAPEESDLRNWIFTLLKNFPNLKKGKQIIEHSEETGKKRKYVDHKQYFIRKKQVNQETQQIINKQYLDFNVNQLNSQFEANNIYDPNDPVHQRIVNKTNKVNLLREDKIVNNRQGMYVEFEKKISENEEFVMNKLRNEVDRFNQHKKDEILHETGLEKELWYRRAKGENFVSKQSKTNQAIQKQIGRFMTFKEEERKRISQKKLD